MTSFRRKQGTYKIQEENGTVRTPKNKKKLMTCFVDLLDETTMNIEIERQAKGIQLLDETFKRLDLVEKDYFGLLYTDNDNGLMCWLEPEKKIRKQNKGEHILKFKFCVKFYVTEPGKLSEEYTRYLFYLQSKLDLSTGRLQCTRITATQLASYIVQAELGDYNSADYEEGYISELKLLPNQTADIEDEIAELHRANVGLKVEEAEYKFLEMAKRVPMYGVDLHTAKDHENIDLQLGVMASGIVVYLKDNKINSFPWANITKISFKKKRFYIHVRTDNDDKYEAKIIGFRIVPYRACKNLWKRCVQYHTFFRLNTPRETGSRGLLRLGSKYHYKGRTQRQAIEDYNNYVRTNSSFERMPSKRVSRRNEKKKAYTSPDHKQTNKNKDHENKHDNNKNHNAGNSSPNNRLTSTPNHLAPTPSDVTSEAMSPPENTRFEYDTQTGEVNINLNSTLNTSSPSSVNDDEEGRISEIKIVPDAAGKFGFNVRGGVDQKMPVIVSKVARKSPAAAASPCLEEGDKVISINRMRVNSLTHGQIVSIIQSSAAKSGDLTLVVKKGCKIKDDHMSVDTDNFEMPDILKSNNFANHTERSISILKTSFQDDSLMNKFNNIYQQTPGLTMVSAKLDENHSKNRFRDTVPYDTTRVKLLEGNDYVNASYVDLQIGADTLYYIASQGPMSSTVNDHWQMIWEQDIELIIMVTECIEKNSVKCSQYWPEPTQTTTYGSLHVSCNSQNQQETCIERVFEVSDDVSKREITHLQYTAWPHHGTPEHPGHFTNFIRLMSERRKNLETPTLVHCSTGIGRTGVVLMVDGALHLIQSKQGVYPHSIVTTLRDQRPKLVNTFPLFKFACHCILHLYGEEVANKGAAINDDVVPGDDKASEQDVSDVNLIAS